MRLLVLSISVLEVGISSSPAIPARFESQKAMFGMEKILPVVVFGVLAVLQRSSTQLRAIDRLWPMKVIVFGAGMSGIIAGILFPQNIENLELAI